MTKRRVVITGLGMVSPLGLTVADSWQGILAGRSGVTRVTDYDVSEFPSQISAAVKDFDASVYLSTKDKRKMDIFTQYGIAAAQQAIDESGIEVTEANAHRIGVALGSGIGGLPFIETNRSTFLDKGPRKVSPFFIPGCIINMLSGHVSIRHGLKGPNIAVVTACTTGAHNIGMAGRMIAYGDADVMVAGGSEMASSELGLSGFAALRALSTRNDDPEAASRPWDKDRDGFVLGAGAGALILEEYEHAKARGANIYAELAGFGMSADAFHMTSPDESGAGGASAMRLAIDDAGMNVADVDYVNAHATSTPAGDVSEITGIRSVLGVHTDKAAISSTKSMIGHLLGAAGAVESIFCVLAIRDSVAPPTINLDNPDEGCGKVNLVANQAQQRPIHFALSNSFGFGGTNACVALKKL